MEIKKINMPDGWKRLFNVAELESIKKIQKSLVEGNDTGKLDLSWEVREVVEVACGHDLEVLQASAEWSHNCRINDYFDVDTGNIDVWLEVVCYGVSDGFYRLGAYLSDMWQVGEANREEIRQHMYIKHYMEV